MKRVFFILLVFFCLFTSSIYSLASDVSFSMLQVTTLQNVYLHSGYRPGLYPYFTPGDTLRLKEGTVLKVLEEIKPDSPLFSDILKVDVLSGYYKGKTGYLSEKYVRFLRPDDLAVKVIFTRDIYDDAGKLLISENSPGTIVSSKLVFNLETLFIKTGEKGNEVIYHCLDKDEVFFIHTKSQEIFYYLNKHYYVYKIIDADTLLPLAGAVINESFVSDEYGLVYINKMPPLLKVSKEGYISREAAGPEPERYLNLILLQSEQLVTPGEKKFNGLSFLIPREVTAPLVLTVHEAGDFNLFCYPALEKAGAYILQGFYIKNDRDIPLELEVQGREDKVEILFYDPVFANWVKQTGVDKTNYSITKSGYYVVTGSKAPEKKVFADIDAPWTSGLLCMGKGGEYSLEIDGSLSLTGGDYQMLYFSPFSPYNVVVNKKKVSTDSKKISLAADGDAKAINPFHRLFLGNWQDELIQKNGYHVKKEEGYYLELLGNMRLTGLNKVEFRYGDLLLKGVIDILNDRQIHIVITYSNKIISSRENRYKVSPSEDSSCLLIPAFYSLYAGYLQISFDKIYLIRNRIYLPGPGREGQVIIGSLPSPFENPSFPAAENKAVYTHYFRKID